MERQDKEKENPREGCGSGRLQEEKKKAPTRAQGKQLKKHGEHDGFFMKSTFPLQFSTKFGPDGFKKHDRLDSKLKSTHFL